MADQLSADTIVQILGAQGCAIAPADAAAIAINLNAQLAVAHADYAALAFEREPSHFDAVIRTGAAQ